LGFYLLGSPSVPLSLTKTTTNKHEGRLFVQMNVKASVGDVAGRVSMKIGSVGSDGSYAACLSATLRHP
jgi:hypothetical protein